MSNPPVEAPPIDTDDSQLYDILIAHLTDFAVFLTDEQGTVVSWNPGVERLLGYTEAEWIGREIDRIFTPEDRAQGTPQKEIETATLTGRAPDTRWHVRRDGKRIFVEGTLVALRGKRHELLGFSKVMRDITARKRHEEQLQNALDYAEGIVNTVSEPLLLLNPTHRVQYANLAFCRHFKIAKTEAEGRLFAEVFDISWDAALTGLLGELDSDTEAVASKELFSDIPKLGRRSVILKARRLWWDGRQSELILLALDDVTDRRDAARALAQSEKQLRMVMNATPAIISYVDRDLRYRTANDSYRRWFGIAPDELIGRPVSDAFESGTYAAIRPYIERALNGEKVTFQYAYPFASGATRTLDVTYTPDLDPTGNVHGFMVLGNDVTERHETERALRISEERWRSLFDQMSEGFFTAELIYDDQGAAMDFRFLEVNPAFERLTGIRGAAGRTIREAIPGISQELIDTYAAVVRTGESTQFEMTIPAVESRTYEARARATGGNQFAVLFLDITSRKNAEQRLQRNLAHQAALVTLGDRLRDLKEHSSPGAVATQIMAAVLEVDRAGYAEMDASGEYITVINEWRGEGVASLSGRHRFGDLGTHLGESLRRGETVVVADVSADPLTSEESSLWKSQHVGALIGVPLMGNGTLAGVLFVHSSNPRFWTEEDFAFVRKVADRTWAAAERARALSELQQSEEFNRSVLASTPDCVKVLDLDGRLLTMNPRGCEQMQIDDLSVYRNRPWSDLWDDMPMLPTEAVREAREGRTTRFEGYGATVKGTPKWWEVVVAPILDGAGTPVRILALSRDITERKGAEKDRERLTRELKRSNEELSHFAHIVAHDLQAPLRGVTSFAQLLKRRVEDKLDPNDMVLLAQILESAGRMNEFVQAVLRFAQLGQGSIELQPVSMEQVAEAALQTLQLPIQELGASIRRENLPKVLGDSVQLTQLLQNLLSNALKYSRKGHQPEIAIRTVRSGQDYIFAVSDNGEGIAPEHLERIFEPLTRLHGLDVPGTGLGLTICQRIAHRHGGRIWVESTPGQGSTFYFTLQSA